MENKETYLQKAWGDNLENVTIEDVQKAIAETKKMDDAHGAFWVGIVEETEVVLETHKDLTVIGSFVDDPDMGIRARFETWKEIEELYKIFLAEDFDGVKTILEANRIMQ